MKIFRLLVLLFVLPFAVMAQEPSQVFDNDAFEKLIARAQDVVDKKQASTSALEELRSQLSTFRSASLNQKAISALKVQPISERLRALGPPPAEGTTEAADVAGLRVELNNQIERARAPVLAAEDNYQQADGLIKAIDAIIRERSTNALLTLEPTPLNPLQWWSALTALTNYSQSVLDEVTKSLNSPVKSSARYSNIPVVAIMVAFALLLLLRSRRWSRRLQEVLERGSKPNSRAIYSFIGALAQLLFPALGLLLLVQAINILDVFELRGYFLLQAIGLAGFSLYFASWLARSLFIGNANNSPLVAVSREDRILLRRCFMVLGIVFALYLLLGAAGNGAGRAMVEANSTLAFPLLLAGGWALFTIGRVLKRMPRNEIAASSNSFMMRISTFIEKFCVAAGIVGPLLAAIGYAQAGQMLVFSTMMSLVLVAGFYILFRLTSVLTGGGSTVVAAGAQDGPANQGAMFRIVLGFAFIILAIPLLAMIWGMRFSELQEIWFWLKDGIKIGDTRVSFTDFLTFILIFSAGYTITRLLQSALRTTVLPNTRLDSGGQMAIVTGTGYLGIFLAALAAISATGLDLSSLAIVAGALSVGIGFGLQTIVSNFVSGIILLIERPIKAGDWIEVGAFSGYVRKISVRSTEIDTFDRASVVIPNADLIAGTVTNWTHSSITGRVRIPVGVAYHSDPRQVEKVLLEIATAHPMVLLDPGPNVMFMGFGADSMDFELRIVLRDVNWTLSAKSDVNYEIVKRFREENIEIPFAQREVTLKNMDELTKAFQQQKT